ncbi:MAG: hypothetical protein H7831_10150, partial [Magnetococcus sp. WYHC-3]
MDNELFAAMTAGATVVTVNRRLSRWLRDAFDQRCRDSGAQAWTAATLLPYEAWLRQAHAEVHERCGGAPLLLDEFQELALWHEALAAEDPEAPPLLNPLAAARQAREAWDLTQRWRVAPHGDSLHGHPDAQAYARWAAHVEARLQTLP